MASTGKAALVPCRRQGGREGKAAVYADICKIPQYLRILLETVLETVRNRLETGLETVANYIETVTFLFEG